MIRLLAGDCREVLATLPDKSVHCVVTSPPYWGLRDYGGVEGQIGLEPTPDAYVATMVEVFREVRRVLRDDGTLWLNLGDSYGGPKGNTAMTDGKSDPARGIAMYGGVTVAYGKAKDLMGIPWRVAFALQANGWWLRQDIIWSKPNPMPESVTDRCTKAHEYIFLLSKSGRYYYDADAIREPQEECERGQNDPALKGGTADSGGLQSGRNNTLRPMDQNGAKRVYNPAGRNKHSVWEVATAPFSEAHFATFPPALIEPCILAGCPEKCCAKCGAPWAREVEKIRTFQSGSGRSGNMPIGKNGANLQGGGATLDIRRGPCVSTKTVDWSPSCFCNAETIPGTCLDPFGGAGTTGLVADRLGRNAILIELNSEYAAMAEGRIKYDAGMFAEVVHS